MKFVKYAIMTLVLATVLDLSIVMAYKTVYNVPTRYDLDKNNAVYTDYYTKINWNTMTYTNDGAFTWLTNPCSTCKIATKLYTAGGDTAEATTTVTGETKPLAPSSMSRPDDFKLKIWRFDPTLLTTVHGGNWIINPKEG